MNHVANTDLENEVGELTREELESVTGGMINLDRHSPAPTGDGVTWVPEGSIKYILAGVVVR
jgi:hypothetical protein